MVDVVEDLKITNNRNYRCKSIIYVKENRQLDYLNGVHWTKLGTFLLNIFTEFRL